MANSVNRCRLPNNKNGRRQNQSCQYPGHTRVRVVFCSTCRSSRKLPLNVYIITLVLFAQTFKVAAFLSPIYVQHT